MKPRKFDIAEAERQYKDAAKERAELWKKYSELKIMLHDRTIKFEEDLKEAKEQLRAAKNNKKLLIKIRAEIDRLKKIFKTVSADLEKTKNEYNRSTWDAMKLYFFVMDEKRKELEWAEDSQK